MPNSCARCHERTARRPRSDDAALYTIPRLYAGTRFRGVVVVEAVASNA